MKSEVIPVESYLNIEDENIKWYKIKEFPGYEATILGSSLLVRSLKMPNVHPYGILVRFDNKNRFELTNRNNQRVKIASEDIVKLMDKSRAISTKYPDVYKARNNRAFINPDASSDVGTITKKPRALKINNESVSMPSFDIPDKIFK